MITAEVSVPEETDRWHRRLYLAMVAVLPLHTVSLDAWISWKPFLVVLVLLIAWDVAAGWRERRWPWHRRASVGLLVLLGALAASYPGGDFTSRYLRFLLAVGVGGAVMLVTARAVRTYSSMAATLRTVFWSGAALGVTAFVLGMVAVGTFGVGLIDSLNDLPLVSELTKEAYLEQGFVAVTNWHEDPGYAAAWANLWAALALVASIRGHGSGTWWLDSVVIGGLGLAVVLTYSRTGLLGLLVAMVATALILRFRNEASWEALALRLGSAAAVTMLLLGVIWLADRPDAGSDIGDAIAFRIEQGFSLGPGEGEGTGGSVEAIDYRGIVWPRYVDFFQEDPWFGAGLSVGWETEGLQEPHNLGLQLAGESGIVGIAGFVVLLALVLMSGGGTVGIVALVVAFSASVTQTILFEPTWWFASGLYLFGGSLRGRGRPTPGGAGSPPLPPS